MRRINPAISTVLLLFLCTFARADEPLSIRVCACELAEVNTVVAWVPIDYDEDGNPNKWHVDACAHQVIFWAKDGGAKDTCLGFFYDAGESWDGSNARFKWWRGCDGLWWFESTSVAGVHLVKSKRLAVSYTGHDPQIERRGPRGNLQPIQ